MHELKSIRDKLTEQENAFLTRLIRRDPLAEIYLKALLFYMGVSIVLLLWPFDFVLIKNHARWIRDSVGIEFPQPGQVLSKSAARPLHRSLAPGKHMSLEVWCASGNLTQDGPARIVSYSLNTGFRNFTLGQSKEALAMRLRTTRTDLNGVTPHLELAGVFTNLEVRHIVVTYDGEVQTVYVNGEQRAERKLPGGSFNNWDPSYQMVLGNEVTGNRPWIGKIYHLAIYDDCLEQKEVQARFKLGWKQKITRTDDYNRVGGLVVRYGFEKGRGRRVKADGGEVGSLDLLIPKIIKTCENSYLEAPVGMDAQKADIVLNILGFVPFGFLFHAVLRTRGNESIGVVVFVLLAGAGFTVGVESLQYVSPTRHSSAVDIACNVLGVVVGIVLDKGYARRLMSQRL